MSELRKANTNLAYFLTLTVVGWIDVFTRKELADIIIEKLKIAQRDFSVAIYAYVIMPSHIHLIAQKNNEDSLNEWIGSFKSLTAKEIIKAINTHDYESRRSWLDYLFKFFAKFQKQNPGYMFWQKTNHPIEVYSHEVFEQKIDYIHNNPVAANIVTDPSYYYYSSANPLSPLIVNEY
jgi:REP element-mobilizing transposase RayT